MHINIKLYVLSTLLTIIGALNWGLVGLLNFDLVAAIFGKKSFISRLIYILVGIAGIYLIIIDKEEYLNLKRWGLIKGEQEYKSKSKSTGEHHYKARQDYNIKSASTEAQHFKGKQHYKGKFYSTGEHHFKGKH
jgi:uncharacterized membrane protein YuzA (DUF378 family)